MIMMSMWKRRPGVDSTYLVSAWLSRLIVAAVVVDGFVRTLASDGGALVVKVGRRRMALMPMWRRRASLLRRRLWGARQYATMRERRRRHGMLRRSRACRFVAAPRWSIRRGHLPLCRVSSERARLRWRCLCGLLGRRDRGRCVVARYCYLVF